jgi:hypothetical protein
VARALAAIGEPDDPRLHADRIELAGRLAALRGEALAALGALGEAARLRSEAGHYRASARALAAAGAAAEAAGLAGEAAKHYLRAGRSAASRGATGPAREWLGQARAIASGAGDAQTAAEAQTALGLLAD